MQILLQVEKTDLSNAIQVLRAVGCQVREHEFHRIMIEKLPKQVFIEAVPRNGSRFEVFVYARTGRNVSQQLASFPAIYFVVAWS